MRHISNAKFPLSDSQVRDYSTFNMIEGTGPLLTRLSQSTPKAIRIVYNTCTPTPTKNMMRSTFSRQLDQLVARS
jgi:hypothetical protein